MKQREESFPSRTTLNQARPKEVEASRRMLKERRSPAGGERLKGKGSKQRRVHGTREGGDEQRVHSRGCFKEGGEDIRSSYPACKAMGAKHQSCPRRARVRERVEGEG